MAYDEGLADRVRRELAGDRAVTEKAMFGGLCFLRGGHMCCGIVGDLLMVRVGAAAHDAALAEPHTRPMDFTGRPMRGLVYVEPEGVDGPSALARWVALGVAHAASLPPKAAAPVRRRKGR